MTGRKRAAATTLPRSGLLQVCAYCRVSTGRQAESDLSIPDQQRQIADFVAAKGWQLAATYTDAGLSATDDNRPEFQAMIDRGNDGSADRWDIT